MSTTILSSLAAYVRWILGLRAMGDATFHSFFGDIEPNVSFSLLAKVFCRAYVDMASASKPDSHPGEPDGALLRSARISSIKLMKAQKSPEHEYILAYVDTVNSDGRRFSLGILKCERTVQSDTSAKMHTKGAVTDIQHITSPSLDAKFEAASNAIPAIDQFIVYHPLTPTKKLSGDDSTVYRHTFPLERQPSLEHLIAAACALHQVAKSYSIFRRQCFWFAGMVYRILVGPDAEDAPAVDTKLVERIISDAEAETRAQAEAKAKADAKAQADAKTQARTEAQADAETPAGGDANVQPRPVVPKNEPARKAGTFKYIFNIVTLTDIENSYKAVEPVFTEMTLEIQARVMATDVSLEERVAHLSPDTKMALLTRDMSDSDCDQLFALLAARRGLRSMAAAGPSSRAD